MTLRKWRVGPLALVACLLLGGCAHNGSGTGRDQQNGFYGGVSGGLSAP